MNKLMITWGDSAGGLLRRLCGPHVGDHDILVVQDDFRFGPLSDADGSGAIRHAMWQAVWKAQWWWVTQAVEASFSRRFLAYQKRLQALREETCPVIVWHGNNVHDRLMLGMIATLLPSTTSLSAASVTTLPDGVWQERKYSAVAMYPPDRLAAVMPEKLSPEYRQELQVLWMNWKVTGQGWRELDVQDCITEFPVGHFDARLLNSFSYEEDRSSAKVIGDMLGRYFIGDAFLFWRLALLQQCGCVTLLPSGKHSPDVRRTG